MDPISKLFCRIFTLTNCNPLYPNALELKYGSWIRYGRQLELIDKPDELPNFIVNLNLLITAPMEGLFNGEDLELSKTALRLRHSRKTITRREVFVGQGGSYQHETFEYLKMDFRYLHRWYELLIFN